MDALIFSANEDVFGKFHRERPILARCASMNRISKPAPRPDSDENPERTDEDFANAVVVRDCVEISAKDARLRREPEKFSNPLTGTT
jgi:hypothetical protein